MDENKFSEPIDLKSIRITDDFWKKEIELVRTEVIPYQWEAINDRVEGASPSYCMRNFKVAGRMHEERARMGSRYNPPVYTFRGFEALPEDPENPDPDKFYGFVFQDTDFSKWIEAVAYSLTQYPDPALEAIADEAIDIVVAAQDEDGYLDTYYIINGRDMTFSNLRDHHELYCFGHLTEGAVAYYEATGKRVLLDAAIRFADFIDMVFGPEPEKCHGYPGHEIAEMALVRLYRATHDERYLALSRFFIDERGTRPYYYDLEDHPDVVIKGHEDEERYAYNQANKPVREQTEATGHAVRAVYLYSGMADIARLYKDEELKSACDRLWDNMVDRRMYITGGIGQTHLGEAFTFDYDLPNDTNYAETCAAIGLIFFARRMLQISPESRYADILERALYNGALSGMALDGKSFFYVNPLEVDPKACALDERKKHVKSVRQKWFGCACCPPNIARLVTSIGEYAYTASEDTVYVHLYIGASFSACGMDVEIRSAFPWSGEVRVRVRAMEDDSLRGKSIALRIPDWCGNEYELKGVEASGTELKDGYLYIDADSLGEEGISMVFPMEVRLLAAKENVPEDFGKAAVQRGPIVYCLEEKDNGSELYKLAIDPDKFESQTHTEFFDIDGNQCRMIYIPGIRRYGYDNADNTLEIANSPRGKLEEPFGSTALYSTYKPLQGRSQTLKFIPYYMWANRGENEMRVWVDVK